MANHSNRHRSSIYFVGYVVDYGGVKMKIPKKLEVKRDELAREFENQAWRAAPYTEVTIDSSFRDGFDAGYQVALNEANERIQVLREALEFYANYENWDETDFMYASNYKPKINHADMYETKECEHFKIQRGGKTARAALKADEEAQK